MKNGITFEAIFAKATTTVDGGWNVTFSLNQDESEQIAALSAHRGELLQVAVIPVNSGKVSYAKT